MLLRRSIDVPITLNHTIVPSHDKTQSAAFLARIMGLHAPGAAGHFVQVRINTDLALDYDNREQFDRHHYAFHVSDREFDEIFGRITAEGVRYGSQPNAPTNGEINTRRGGR